MSAPPSPPALRALRFAWLCRAFAVTAGQAALRRALPLYFAVGIAAVIIFSGNGMDARTLTREAEERLGFRALMVGSWVLMTLPAARSWLICPETLFIRSLPVSPGAIASVLALGLGAVHAPWLALWWRGEGALSAAWAAASAAALQSSALLGGRRPLHALLIAGALGSVWIGPGAPGAVIALGALVLSMAAVWRAGSGPARGRQNWVASSGPFIAWCSALAVLTYRGHAALLHRMAMLGLAAAWTVALGLRNGAHAGLGLTRLSAVILAPAVSLGAIGLAGPVLRAEDDLSWLLRSTAAPPRVYLAKVLLMGWVGVSSGWLFAAVVTVAAGLGRAPGIRLAASSSAIAAAAAVLALSAARCALSGDGNDAGRLVIAALGVSAICVLASLQFAAEAPLLVVTSALLLWPFAGRAQRRAARC